MKYPKGNTGDSCLRVHAINLLRQVIDPELGINIVDMGLVYSVEVNESAKHIDVVMTLSTKGCPMGAAISGAVENTLKLHFPSYSHAVRLVWEPSWCGDFISPAGRLKLEF